MYSRSQRWFEEFIWKSKLVHLHVQATFGEQYAGTLMAYMCVVPGFHVLLMLLLPSLCFVQVATIKHYPEQGFTLRMD